MPREVPTPTPTATRAPRTPLTRGQVKALLEVARGDALLHPLLVAAVYTGLRLGDLCNLRWSAVDFTAGRIAVPATTAGRHVLLPLLPPLRDLLDARRAQGGTPRAFIFPEAARRYNYVNAHGVHSLRGALLTRAKVLIARALAAAPPARGREKGAPPPPVPDVVARIRGAGFAPSKATRIATTYELFHAGRTYSQIAAVTGRSKGQCSEDLRAVERLLGRRLRPGGAAGGGRATAAALLQATRRADAPAARQTSLYGWRSLRPAFCQLALDEGLPLAAVEPIVGRTALAEALRRRHEEQEEGAAGGLAARALARAREVITPRQTAFLNAVLHAAGVAAEADPDPRRALSLLGTAVVEKTKSRIAAALKAAGIRAP